MSTNYLSSFFALRNQNSITKIFIITLWLFPLLFFLVHGWVDILSYLLALCAVDLLCRKHIAGPLQSSSLWIIAALSASFLAILISSALRGQLLFPMLDGPARYLLVIPIFFIIKQKEINFSRIFEYSCPIAVLLFALQASIHPLFRDEVRLIAPTLYDPNLVGVYTITLAFTCLTSFSWRQDAIALRALKILAIVSGAVLSCFSQSRSGFSAGAALLIFWLALHYRYMTLKNILITLAILFFLCIAFYHIDILHHRVEEAIREVLAWSNGQNKDTSCGIRLTMWQIALRLFSLHPLQGYGDHHLASYFTDPYITQIGTPIALFTMQHVGPHNDLLQNMVLAGIWGLAAVLLVILVPFILFLCIYFTQPNLQTKKACLQGLCVIIGVFVGGFFSILLGLKMSVTFYAVIVYGLLATAFWQQKNP